MKRPTTEESPSTKWLKIPQSSILILFCLFLGIPQSAKAQTWLPTGTGGPTASTPFTVVLKAVRDDDTQRYIYDDFNFLPHAWNCGKSFLFPSYVGAPIDIYFGNSSGVTSNVNVEVKLNGLLVGNYATANGTAFTYTPTAVGEYAFTCSQGLGVTPLTGYVSVQPKLQELSLVLPPICAESYPVGQDYAIKLNSSPAFNTIVHHYGEQPINIATGPPDATTADCGGHGDVISYSISATTNVAAPVYLVGQSSFSYWSFLPHEYDASHHTPFPPNMEDLYIKYADLAPYLTGGYAEG